MFVMVEEGHFKGNGENMYLFEVFGGIWLALPELESGNGDKQGSFLL